MTIVWVLAGWCVLSVLVAATYALGLWRIVPRDETKGEDKRP